ncbi:uncharacterized protein LOC124159355 [Ischnura elegans]|uniref:uncharacterized protein LOC124159355 n=1 Tax=Ischnura elegans TaxID=197161 RepID=UPI001ED88CD9|nr:uncharacterized protein LOC124159355 [Ischnura elegans]
MSEFWWGRMKAFRSYMSSLAGRVSAEVLPESAVEAPLYASVLFIASSAVFLFQATKRISRQAQPPPPHPVIGPVDQLQDRIERRGNVLDRLARRFQLGTAQDAVLQEVLFTWLLAESFRLWLWMVGGVDSLLNSYWIKMAEIFPPSGGRPSTAGEQHMSLSSMLPIVLGIRGSWTSLTAPNAPAPEPDLSRLHPMVRPLLRPSFLRPFVLCLIGLCPLLLLKLLPPARDRRDEVFEHNDHMMFWVPLMPQVRWEETEFGPSGYFLSREPPRTTEPLEERLLVPTTHWSESRVRHPSQPPGASRVGAWRTRSRSRSSRPYERTLRTENLLKPSKST